MDVPVDEEMIADTINLWDDKEELVRYGVSYKEVTE